MKYENAIETKIVWRKIENNIFTTHFRSADSIKGTFGTQVYVKKFEAIKNDSNKKITVFLLHDIGQYHGRFNKFINWTRAKNPDISFIALDFVGHGLSSGTRGHFEKIDHLAKDFLYLMNQIVKDSHHNEKWLLMGHGLGGLVALDFSNRFQLLENKSIDGLILSNFIFNLPPFYVKLEKFLIKTNKLLAHSRPYHFLDGEKILSCSNEILIYEQDPLVNKRPTLNAIREIQNKNSNIFQDAYFLDKPILLLNSDLDVFSRNKSLNYFARGIKKDLLSEKKYSLMKHDLYNESEREIVFRDITNWMKRYEN